MTIKEKILSIICIDENTGCWNLGNLKNPLRYGYVFTGSKTDGTAKQIGAHRASYEVFVGKIPKGMLVCHKCDNRHCVNPEHLFLGTYYDNNHDMLSKGREGTLPGIKNRNAKLSEKQVYEIRQKWLDGKSKSAIGREYGISQSQICKIINGKRWAHLLPIEYRGEQSC